MAVIKKIDFLTHENLLLFACDPDLPSVLVWVQTVCIGYQQTTKIAANTYMQTVCKDYQLNYC